MIRITKPTVGDVSGLLEVATRTFIQSHGHSASQKDIEAYLEEHYTEDSFKKEIEDKKNHYFLLFDENKLIGYSKVVLNQPVGSLKEERVTKLERIYILSDYYGKGLGEKLFEYNVAFAQSHNQQGMWLHSWVENKRAIAFYEKKGFKIVGEHDFRISETHTNPNWKMYLKF